MPQNPHRKFALYPLLWLAVCFAVGILTANFFAFGWRIYLFVSLASASFSVISLRRKSFLVFLSLSFIAIGALHSRIEIEFVAENRIKKIYDVNQIESGEPVEIEGIIEGKPELAVGRFLLIVRAEKINYKNLETSVSGRLRFFAAVQNEQIQNEYEQLNLAHGSQVRVVCNLQRTDHFRNEGVASNKLLLDQKQIDATAIIKSPLLIEKIGETKDFILFGWIYERRQNLIVEFQNRFSVSTAGVLIASLLGNGSFLDKPTAEVFREGGTFHVLVISGLHITFIGGLTLIFVQFFTNRRLWQFFIACGLLWTYAIAVGADIPVVRAAIMFTILLFSQIIYRNGLLLNALGLCALILFVWRPSDVFTQSFQLTFASVAALVAVAFPLIERLRRIGEWYPSVEAPFPPNVSVWLKTFCQKLYWREDFWKREISRQIWSANLFNSPHLKWFKNHTRQSFVRYAFEAILVSLIVQIFLLPLLVVYFHRIAPVSIFLNLWVGLIIALESFVALAAVLLGQISDVLALPLVNLTELLNWLLVAVPKFFVDFSWANFRLPIYSGALKAVYFLYFVPVILLLAALNNWNPFALVAEKDFRFTTLKVRKSLIVYSSVWFLFFLSVVIVFHPFSAPRGDGRLSINFFDVGQGDSALIRFPNGETMLVDGGGKRSFNQINLGTADEPEFFEPDAGTIGERVVSEFLWEKGYSQVDYILATHADADHLQGLVDVAKNFRVRAAFFGRKPFETPDFKKLDSILKERGVESVVLSRGDELIFDDLRIEVLHPQRDDSENAVSDNNSSLVLRINFGERKILLTGDIEKETEKLLVNTPHLLQSDVVKAAHHGSRTSSIEEFVAITGAKLTVVPVGIESPYGHPHREVLERWKNSGARILTTGENGTITVSTDGKDLQLKTFNKEKIYR